MGNEEEAENDRRKLMNKIFCSALTAVVAGTMLTGCAMPWEKGADDDVAPDGYSYTADSNSEQKQAYRWLIEPTINADNIISFDGSQVDPNNENANLEVPTPKKCCKQRKFGFFCVKFQFSS